MTKNDKGICQGKDMNNQIYIITHSVLTACTCRAKDQNFTLATMTLRSSLSIGVVFSIILHVYTKVCVLSLYLVNLTLIYIALLVDMAGLLGY